MMRESKFKGLNRNKGESILDHLPSCWAWGTSPLPKEAGFTLQGLYLLPPFGPSANAEVFLPKKRLHFCASSLPLALWKGSSFLISLLEVSLTAPLTRPSPHIHRTEGPWDSDTASLTVQRWPKEPEKGLWRRITLSSDPQDSRTCLHRHEA